MKTKLKKLIPLFVFTLSASLPLFANGKALPSNIEKYIVKTESPENLQVPFYLRIPKGFAKHPEKKYWRVLFICPVYKGSGRAVITGINKNYLPLLKAADERGWFVVSCTFHQKSSEARNHKKSYYYPKLWSGDAVLNGLKQMKEKHPKMNINHLLLMGFSGGSQFVHRFAIWDPDRVVAVASNSASWHSAPKPSSVKVAWLVTIGDSDPAFESSWRFVDQLRKVGVAPLFRSFIGMTHQWEFGKSDVFTLDAVFLEYYDSITQRQLNQPFSIKSNKLKPPMPASAMPFVGDAQDFSYLPNTPENAESIPQDSRVYIPSVAIAKLWGKPSKEKQAR